MGEWKEYKIGDVCNTISDTYKGNAEEVVLINTSDVLEGRCVNHEKVPNKDLKGQFKKTFQRDDILYSEIRPANKRFAYIDFDPIDYIASTKLMVIRHNKKILPQYLFYILKSQVVIDELQMLAESRSGTFPQITFSELAKLEIVLPPPSEQARILTVLKPLDDKIENNRRVNENLEQQAQALFKSWFVDFEPFKNCEFVESELGMIPKGWRVKSLGDLITVIDNRGKTPPLCSNTNYPIIDVKSLSTAGRILNYDNCTKYVSQETYKTWFRNGHPQYYDLLLSTVGSLAEIKLFTGGNGCIAQNVVALRNRDIALFLFDYLNYIKSELISYNIGSVQPSIKVTHIIKHKILVPSNDILNNYTYYCKEITDLISNNCKIINSLTNLRDTLLPKLMSGELRVPETDLINEILEKK